jgi:hypothetical protein
VIVSGSELKKLLKGLEQLVDGGFLREAAWAAVARCQKFGDGWELDEDSVRLVTFGVRITAAERIDPCLSMLTRLLDHALLAATAGVPIVRPQLLEEMNSARIVAFQVLYKVSALPLVTV